jgi:hypothetical protein
MVPKPLPNLVPSSRLDSSCLKSKIKSPGPLLKQCVTPFTIRLSRSQVFLISDIHTDYQENLEWLQNLSQTSFLNDALIVAGDVSDSIPRFEETFQILRPKFAHVFFTPGNHDLWVRTSESSPKPASEPSSEATNGASSRAVTEPVPETTSRSTSEADGKTVSKPTSEAGVTSTSEPASSPNAKPAANPALETTSTPPPEDSISKLAILLKICEDLGVDTRPKFLTARAGGKWRTQGTGHAALQGLEGLTSGGGSNRLESGGESGANGVSRKREEGQDLRVSVGAIGASGERGGTSSGGGFRTGGSKDEGGSRGVPLVDEALKGDASLVGSTKDGVSKGIFPSAEAENGKASLEGASREGDPEAGPSESGQGQRLPGLTRGGGNGAEASTCEPRASSRKGAAEQGETGVWVVPILSWHHISFDTEPDIPGYNIPPIEKVSGHFC